MTYDWELRAQQNCYWKVRINHGARRYKEAEIDKKKKRKDECNEEAQVEYRGDPTQERYR